MSQLLISLTELAQVISLIFTFSVFLCMVLWIAKDISSIRDNNKVEKLKNIRKDNEERYHKEISKFKTDIYTENEEEEKKKEEIKERFVEEDEELVEKIEKRKKKSQKKEIRYLFLQCIAVVVTVLSLVAYVLVNSSTGGEFSYIKPVEYNNENVCVTAYYDVDYKQVSQDSLVVFVKNDSDKTVLKATIQVENTNSFADIYYLEPGEEKIVTLEVHTRENNDYSFIIKDIVFSE